MDISLVIPAYNEGKNVFLLALEIEKVIDSQDQFEIVFVDDGSTDDTLTCMLEAKRSIDLDINIIQSKNNNGQSIAILMGIKEAKHDWVITLDSDLQNSPENLVTLIEQIRNQPDFYVDVLISGVRAQRNDNFIKRISSKVANAVRQFILNDHCVDTGCGLKLFHRDFFLKLPQFKNMHRFLPALYQMYGGRCVFLAVTHSPRVAGESKYGTLDRLIAGIWDLMGVVWLRNRKVLNLTYDRRE